MGESRAHRLSMLPQVALVVLSAIAIAVSSRQMQVAWPPPGWPFAPSLPFVTPKVPAAAAWWSTIVGWEALWSIALIALVYVLAGYPTHAGASAVRPIVVTQLVLLGVLLAAPLPFNSDQYGYVSYGDLVLAGYNPYDPPLKSAAVPAQVREVATVWGIVHEGARNATQRVIVRNRYGPAWTLATAGVLYPFHHLSTLVQARILRIVSALTLVGCTLLLWRALGPMPQRTAALAAFALNPVVVTQTALGGHNDVAPLLLALAAYLAAARQRFLVAGIAAGLSLGMKVTFAPYLAPLIAYAIIKGGVREAIRTALAAAVMLFAAALPFGGVRAIVQPIADASKFNRSYVVDALEHFVTRHLPALSAMPLEYAYLFLVGVAALALTFCALAQRRSAPSEAALPLLLFSAGKFEPWYALNLTPLLLVRAWWSLPIFLGISLASQLLEQKNFIGGYDELPFAPFVGLALVLSVASLAVFRYAAAIWGSQKSSR